jgi:hypothetical protein
MGFRKAVGAVALSLGLVFGGPTMAQTPPELNAAIAAGDIPRIGAIITANQNNPAVLADIALALLAAAESVKTTNPQLAALLAAEAVTTGALTEADQLRALNIVGLNPAALALLTNANAPNQFGGAPDRPVGGAENGRTSENSQQNTTSQN